MEPSRPAIPNSRYRRQSAPANEIHGRSFSEGTLRKSRRPNVTRDDSTGSSGYTLEVRCACQFFQCDSLLPERTARIISSRPTSRASNVASPTRDHEYEPVNPPPENSGFSTPSTPQEEKKPSTPVTDSDIEFLAAKAADFELLSKGITTTKPGGDAVFIPLAAVLKEVESEEKDKETHVQESHGKKFQEAIKSSASKLHRQASMISNKVGSEAEKIHTRVKSIKRPKISMPATPKFEKPHMPKFHKPKMPTMPKMSRPRMPKMSKPKMPTMPKMSRPRMPESMKNITMPTFKLPKRGRQRRQLNSSTTESTAGGSRKKIFDFATYPRMFHRKKKESDQGINTPRTGTDITPTSEPSTLRPSFLFGNRWKKGKFTETPAVDVAQGSLMSKASERSDAQGSVRVPLHSETSMDNESLDLRSRVEKEADMILASGSQYDEDTEHEAYMKENQEIHRASSLNAKLNDRWSHGVFRENTSYENEDTSNGQFASSYDNIPRPGVVEEINEDEFIIRQKGISRDNIQVREILTSEIKKSFSKSPDDQPYTKPDMGSSDTSLPEVPKRRGLKKPKHKKTPHVSHEAITYEPDESTMEIEQGRRSYQDEPQLESRSYRDEIQLETRSYQDETQLDRASFHDQEIEQDRRSYQEPERPQRRSRSRKDHSLDSEGGRSLEHEHEGIRPKPMRRSRKDYSLDSQDYEPEVSGEATPSSQMVSDENITRPQRRSRSKKQHSLDSYEGGPSYEISYEISGNETPLSYEISDENILSGNDYLDYKMYENERMEGKDQPGIVVSDPYQESLFHPNFDDVPLAPPRKHRSLKSLNVSEQDSITAELGYKEISDHNLDFNLPHEYQIPTPDEEAAPQRPTRTRSRTRSHSRYEEDSISKRTESILSLEPEESLEYIGYSVINKSHKEPKAPRRKRSIKSNKSEERRFHTVPRPLNDTQPVRPLRNYSTLGPSRPPRKTSVPNLTDEEKENVSVSPYIEIDDKDLQSGEVIQKMKDRPLPAPPRPPRKSRGRYLRDISQERNIMEGAGMETEVSVQTEPLPEGFECEELVQEMDDRVITPSKHKRLVGTYKNYEEFEGEKDRKHEESTEEKDRISRSYADETPKIPRRPITEFDHQETITHGTLLVQPYSGHERIDNTPIQSFEKSTERIVTVRREFDETTEIPEDFKKLRDPQPQIIERIIERHIPSQLDPTAEMELIKTHKLQVQDLDVDRLAVNELHANKIKVSEIDSSSITTGEINSNSGNLVVGGIELPASFFQQIVEKLQEQAEHLMPRMQQQEKQSSEKVKSDESSSEVRTSKSSADKDKQSDSSREMKSETKSDEGDFLDEAKESARSEDIPKTGDFLDERLPQARKDEGASGVQDFLSEESARVQKEREDFLSKGTSGIQSETKDFLSKEVLKDEEEHFLSEEIPKVEEEYFLSEEIPEDDEEHFVSKEIPKDEEQHFLSEEVITDKAEHFLVEEVPKDEEAHFLSEEIIKNEAEHFLAEEVPKNEEEHFVYEETELKDLEEEELDPELQKQESIVKEYEDIASQLRLEEEKFQETLKKVEEIMQKSELGEGITPEELKESIAMEIDDLIKTAATEVSALQGIDEPSATTVASTQLEEYPTENLASSSGRGLEEETIDEPDQKKTSAEEAVEDLQIVEEVELVLEPPPRPPRSKPSKPKKDLIDPEISDLDKPLAEEEIGKTEARTKESIEEEMIRLCLEEAEIMIREGILPADEEGVAPKTEGQVTTVVEEGVVPKTGGQARTVVQEGVVPKTEGQVIKVVREEVLSKTEGPVSTVVAEEVPSVPKRISSKTVERLTAKVEEQCSPLDVHLVPDTRIPSEIGTAVIPQEIDERITSSRADAIASETAHERIPSSRTDGIDSETAHERIPSSEIETRIPSEAPLKTSLAEDKMPPFAESRFKVEPTAPKDESEETPPPRPPHPITDADYIPSQPPASFFALRSPPTFRDLDIDDDIPMVPRRRRHHKTQLQTPSSSEEVHPSTRRRQRTPEPSIPELTSQLTRACVTAADKSLRRLIQQITNRVLGNADEKQDVNLIVVILLVLIACLILLGWDSSRQVHHHHWEYFNPPRDL